MSAMIGMLWRTARPGSAGRGQSVRVCSAAAVWMLAIVVAIASARGVEAQSNTGPATPAASSETSCSPEDVAKAVNSAGAELRRVNGEALPRLRLKMQVLRERKGWSEADYEAEAMALIGDARMAEFDSQANAHLERIDALSRAPADGTADCAVVAEIRARAIELVATVRAKSEHALRRLDQAIAAAAQPRPPETAATEARPAASPPPRQAAVTPPQPPPPAKAPPAAATVPAPAVQSPAAAPPAARRDAPARTPGWQTTTAETTSGLGQAQPSAAPGAPPSAAPPATGVYIVPSEADGYTIDEIREATRGFFGQISTGLASVIEHAFQKAGRPTAYVLGNEGGGAFLAGLRYGEGSLYLRRGGQRQIYWHGPSVGGDVGLSGTKTMFLIYKLDAPEKLYGRFTGIDGSAFFVGGVGLTLLTNGSVVMAPIRSGVGFRLGASIGYLRFTETQTWNPF